MDIKSLNKELAHSTSQEARDKAYKQLKAHLSKGKVVEEKRILFEGIFFCKSNTHLIRARPLAC